MILTLVVATMSGCGGRADSTALPRPLPLDDGKRIEAVDTLSPEQQAAQREYARRLVSQAWRKVRAGELHSAMTQFNDAWRLDANNYNVYWGYAAILQAHADQTADAAQARSTIDDSLAMFERSIELRPNDARLLVETAEAYLLSARSGQAPEVAAEANPYNQHFSMTGALLQRAEAIDPDNKHLWKVRTLLEWYRGDLSACDAAMIRAKALGVEFDVGFEARYLQSKNGAAGK